MKAQIIGTVAAVLLLGLTAPAVAKAHGGHEHPAVDPSAACSTGFREVRGQGLSCRTPGGLWKVKHRDGSVSFTHGPDAAPSYSGQLGNLGGTARQPACGVDYYRRAVIALPSDLVGDKTVASFRSDINNANGAFFDAAVESGSTNGADLIFLCDSTGAVRVDVVRLAHTKAQGTWSTIISDLKALGYNRTYEQYAVYYEATPVGATCGQGEIQTDDTDSSSNQNNVGPDFAFVYNCNDGGSTLLHEIGHNLGAVQPGAPSSTGVSSTNGWHCYEAYDVMCYNDGGNLDPGYIVKNCSESFDHFDCRHDSYFDAKIGAGQGGGAGSYIDTHWNIGECYVRWVENQACLATDTTAPVVGSVSQVMPSILTATGSAIDSSGRVPVKASWSATDNSGSIAAYDVQVATNGTWTRLSSSGTATTAFFAPGANSYQFRVAAKDAAGNWSAWKYGSSFKLTTIQEDSSAIAFAGSWTRFAWASAWGGYEKTSSTANATAKLSFTGRNVAWIAPTASNRGSATVSVDGTAWGSRDLYSATTLARAVAFSYYWTSAGTHTIEIKVAGTTGRPAIDVDAFVVMS